METETNEKSSVMTELVEVSTPPVRPSRVRVLVEFVIFGGVFVWAGLAPIRLPISWGESHFSIEQLQSNPPALALLATVLLWIHGGIRELNFSWPKPWTRYLWQLPLILVGFFVLSVAFSWINHLLWGDSPEADEMNRKVTGPELRSFFLLIFPLWAFAEELFYRAYLIQRLERIASGWRHSTWLAVLLSSVIFALCHLQYGEGKLPAYVFMGLIFSGIYLYTKRSIWFVTLVHWLSNTLMLVLG